MSYVLHFEGPILDVCDDSLDCLGYQDGGFQLWKLLIPVHHHHVHDHRSLHHYHHHHCVPLSPAVMNHPEHEAGLARPAVTHQHNLSGWRTS